MQCSESQHVEIAASLCRSCVPAHPGARTGLKGGSARSEVGPARPVAHRSRSACCAEVAQHQRRPALTARVKAGTSCRRSTRCAPGVPGCGYGPFSVVGRPRVLNIRQRDPQVHRRPRERARDPRTARLGPSGTRPCIRGASSPSRPFLAHVIAVGDSGSIRGSSHSITPHQALRASF